MQRERKNKIQELHTILSKMPINVFCTAALPEFGVQWREVARGVRNSRLPMQPSSIARVMCKHISQALSSEEIEDIVAILRLKLIVTQTRTWHVLRLSEPTTDEHVANIINDLPQRVMQALRKDRRGMKPEVKTVLVGELLYLSVQLMSEHKEGSILYMATPPGAPVAVVSSTTMKGLLKGCVQGLGYKKYENAKLSGHDIKSLLRINNESWNENADHLTEIPEYAPKPVITKNGIDYTGRQYDENYVDSILGPDPPLLTDLQINMTKEFFDRNFLDKQIRMSIGIKSENVAKTLKSWVSKGVIPPTSDLFRIFREIKSNNINYTKEDSD